LRTSFCWFLLIAFILIGCGKPPRPALAADADLTGHPALGCWELFEPEGSGFVRVPKEIRLDPELEPWHDSSFVAHAEIDSIYRDHGAKSARWGPHPDRGDIYVSWDDGFTGMFTHVRVEGDGFQGPSYETSDAGPRTWRRGVIKGSRVECKAPGARGER
jgi:hypothetical protein